MPVDVDTVAPTPKLFAWGGDDKGTGAATEDLKKSGFWDPVSGAQMAASVYSTWPNPKGPMVYAYCEGCDAERYVPLVDIRAGRPNNRPFLCRECFPKLINRYYRAPWHEPLVPRDRC